MYKSYLYMVINYLDIHTHKNIQCESIISVQSLSLTQQKFDKIPVDQFISVGLHPWYAKLNQLESHIKILSEIAKQDNVKMIGECGLDKLRGEPMANQILILKRQIELAEKLNKPLILHCVRAFDELIALKKELNIKVPIIIHGFNKNEELGVQLLAKGFWLSFGIAVLNKNASVVKLIQKTDQFFLETDDSNCPIEEIYQAVAKIKNCSINELKARIFAKWKILTDK